MADPGVGDPVFGGGEAGVSDGEESLEFDLVVGFVDFLLEAVDAHDFAELGSHGGLVGWHVLGKAGFEVALAEAAGGVPLGGVVVASVFDHGVVGRGVFHGVYALVLPLH